jgi:predicted aldo/keto reductase-like oxidoreductase
MLMEGKDEVMEYRTLGRTGLRVSVIGFGGIPIQRVDEASAGAILERALDLGVNFIDTARGYTDSEQKIGKVLRCRRKDCILASKAMARTSEAMTKEIETSLKDLQTDYLDLYQLHNVKDEVTLQQVMDPGGALEALDRARQAGKICFIGITGHKPSALVSAIATGIFDTVQFPFNFLEQEAAKALLPLAREQNTGTIAMKPLAGGAFRQAELSLRWIIQQTTMAIPGIDALSQVEKNVTAGTAVPLSVKEEQLLAAEAGKLGERFCRRCEYCLPCPAGISIPTMFLFDGYLTRYGLADWARERYWALSQQIGACLDCGECEQKCPYQLPVREMLREARGNLEG